MDNEDKRQIECLNNVHKKFFVDLLEQLTPEEAGLFLSKFNNEIKLYLISPRKDKR